MRFDDSSVQIVCWDARSPSDFIDIGQAEAPILRHDVPQLSRDRAHAILDLQRVKCALLLYYRIYYITVSWRDKYTKGCAVLGPADLPLTDQTRRDCVSIRQATRPPEE
jgi:hypothetical protein